MLTELLQENVSQESKENIKKVLHVGLQQSTQESGEESGNILSRYRHSNSILFININIFSINIYNMYRNIPS